MARYALLINAPTDDEEVPPDELAAHVAYADVVAERGGAVVTGYALHPAATATTLRGTLVIDGPFAEAKEVVAGFCVLEARDLDHAIELARLNPATRRGSVELRPLR